MKKYIAFLLILTQCCIADGTTLYVEPEAGRQPLCDAIQQAHQEVDIAMYMFTDVPLKECLKEAAAKGVKVKLLLEAAPYKYSQANKNTGFENSPIQLHWVPAQNSGIRFYHEKLMLIDHQEAWVMTANFTRSSFKEHPMERNFILRDNNTNQVRELQNLFDQDWNNIVVGNAADYQAIVVSPLNSREQLLSLIHSAQSEIYMYSEGLNDYQLIGALAKAARKGVNVKIIYSDGIRVKAQQYLTRNQVELIQLQQMRNHAKVIMVDHQTFYLGSVNFTSNSLDHNREVGVIVADPKLVGSLESQFAKDRSQSA